MKLRCVQHRQRVIVRAHTAYHRDFMDECPSAARASGITYGRHVTNASEITTLKTNDGARLKRYFDPNDREEMRFVIMDAVYDAPYGVLNVQPL